ncbi:MAG: methyltransferase [Candidatus Rokubacteria bacterium]|nr:methyltransferase [Candidatus Rokubacteria bacterium]
MGHVLKPPPPDQSRRLQQFFAEAGYTEEGFVAALRTVEPPLPHLRSLPRLLDLTREPTVFNTLARWFLAGLPVDAGRARESTPDWFRRTCLESGLLFSDGEALVPTSLLVPSGKFLVAADLYQRLLSATDFDHVLTINPAARLLLDFTIRRPSWSTLDLCAGCGIQALAAAAHSQVVVATDLNPRATAFAAFNARLNGCENLDFLTGDGFAPVEGRAFDLIVCNPPFILAPTKRYLYRDNDMDLDGFCRALVRQAPRHLNEGGYFQMIFEWAQVQGQAWQERVAEWFEGTGCDVWLLKNYTQEPGWYAQIRLRETPFRSQEADAAGYDEWMTYYRGRRVEAMHGGLVAMRRRSGPNWLRIEELPESLHPPFGQSILRGFEARDFLEAHPSDEGLLACRLKVAGEVRLDQEYRWSEGHWRTVAIRLRLAEGLPRAMGLDGDVAQFLARFDGTRTVREVIRTLASEVAVDPARVQAESLAVVRHMVERGILLL